MGSSDPAGETENDGDDADTSRRESIEDDGPVRSFLTTDGEPASLVRDVLSSVAIVGVIGLLLLAVSGVWPPLVAVESGSMEPNVEVGDLVVVVAPDRFADDDSAADTGVTPLADDQDGETFGTGGDVIVFAPGGDDRRTPIIHRAHLWVEADENWVETRADEEYVNGDSCEAVEDCPAPHDGFVTKGDANRHYDQAGGLYSRDNSVVKPEWILGKASFRIPWLGYVRLTFGQLLVSGQGSVGTVAIASAVGATFTGSLAACSRRRSYRNN